jgi:acyl transferase domain-containing protein/NAD(P)-dependent dehydrogenase (short-subunit alcohol dehydrogenase family)
VSSFGFGGVNVHMILEEHGRQSGSWHRINRLPRMIFIDGKSSENLAATCRSLLDQLTNATDPTKPNAFENVLAPYFDGPIQTDHPRLGFTCLDGKEAAAKLESALDSFEKRPGQNWNHPAGLFFRLKSIDKQSKIVAMFPGQGAQYVSMGKEIAQNYPELMHAFQTMDTILASADAAPVSDIVFHRTPFSKRADKQVPSPIEQTQNAQPILAAFCTGLYNILRAVGFQPDICIGHSFGELVALWAGGAFTTKDLFILSLIRGRCMQMAMGPDDDPGAMLAVMHAMNDQLTGMIKAAKHISVANYNAPDQIVLSGSTQSLDRLSRNLRQMDVKTIKLQVSGAFHSDYMKTAAGIFEKEMARVPVHRLSLPVYSNRHAQPYPSTSKSFSKILSEHLHHPVLFQPSLEAVFKAGARVFVEIGPRRILSDYVKAILKDHHIDVISVNPSPGKDSVRQLREAVTQLRVIGLKLGDDRYQPGKRQDTPDKKDSFKVVLKGRNYFSPATQEKMTAAMEVPMAPKDISLQNGPEKELTNTHPVMSDERREVLCRQNHENERMAATDLDRIIQNHIANSHLQKQFLMNQERQLAIVDKLVDGQNDAIRTNDGSRTHHAINESHSSTMDHLARMNNRFYHAHLTYLNHQHAILSRITDPNVQHPRASHGSELPDAIPWHDVEPSRTAPAIGEIAPAVSSDDHPISPPGRESLPLSVQEHDSRNRHTTEAVQESAPQPTAQAFTDMLLSIVTDQTGYPEETLDLDMDIEADLGIDSIKRMEIFSRIHEAFPNASADIELGDLAELKTLQEVVDFFHQTVATPDDHAVLQEKAGKTVATRYVARAVPVDLPKTGQLNLSPDEQILIVDDGDETGIRLQQVLSDKGYKTTVLQFNEFNPASKKKTDLSVDLHSLNDKAIQVLIDAIIEKNGPIGGFVHINPLVKKYGDIAEFFNTNESQLLKTVFFMAKHLKPLMPAGTDTAHRFFFIVTRIDGKIGLNGIQLRSVLQGGYYGLTKSLKKEAPHLFCRNIDIAPHITSADMSAIILEELHDTDDLHLEIGRTARTERFVLGKKKSVVKHNGNGSAGPGQHSVFLVSGGGRGITARCLEGMAASYQCKFIILGRTAIDTQEPSWARGIHDEHRLKRIVLENLKKTNKRPTPKKVETRLKAILNRREILQTLDNISNAGAEAMYVEADITDTQHLREKIKPAVDRLGPITGIIHGAGNLADKQLEKKQEADYDLVFQTKVQGLKTMMDCVTPSKIRYVILFSSVSGFLGQIGQTDYSLANEILNKFAHALDKHCPDALIRSINWGPWDGGMVTPELKRIYRQLNIDIIPIAEGVKRFMEELANDEKANDQIIICPESLYQFNGTEEQMWYRLRLPE